MLVDKYNRIILNKTHFLNNSGAVEKIYDKRKGDKDCEQVRLNGIYYYFNQVQLLQGWKE